MRILITGASGFVGSWLTSHLACQGHEVFAMSRVGSQADFICDCAKIVGDVTEAPEKLAEILPDSLDLCLHTASFNEYFSLGYATKALLVNGLGTRNMLEALRLRSEAVPALTEQATLPAFIYFSTFHVYGVDQGLVREDDPPAPRNDYAFTHLIGEEYCRFYARVHGFPTLVLRLSNGYGAPKTQPFGKWYLLMHDLCREVFSTGSLTLRSDPATRRDFVWLGDVAKIVEQLGELLSQHLDLHGQALNLASGRGLPIGELASRVVVVYERFSGKKAELRLPNAGMFAAHASDGNFSEELVIDNLRLKTLMGQDFKFIDNLDDEIWNTLEFLKEYGSEG